MYKEITTLSFLLIFCISSSAQFSISGNVTNKNGEKIEFASIFLEGTQWAAVSDNDGKYHIANVPNGQYQIKCTYLGYQSFYSTIEIDGKDVLLDIKLEGDVYQLDKVEILANRVSEDAAFTYDNVEKEEIEALNNGKDMPYILRFSPSVVVTSDAGNGVGYTGVRIRGSDATRVNITVNGIPINDAESQGVFWVNMPDFASSVDNIQVQRGVGTSTSGVGAFGGSVSLNTQKTYLNPYARITSGYGSFNTRRFNLMLGSGLINERYSFDLRYSLIDSDGYVDRAAANLNSIYFAASSLSESNSTRLLIFSGSEQTYQSWWGVPETKFNRDQGALLEHYQNNLGSIYQTFQDSINLFNSDRRYNYYTYENQVDDYGQTHIQLLDNRKLGEQWVLNTALNFTHGFGFFEEYKVEEALEDYNLGEGFSDLVRRRWLDNNFYGGNITLNSTGLDNWDFNLGISAFQYEGDHFGRVIDVILPVEINKGKNYYFNVGNKKDLSSYLKTSYRPNEKFSIFGDFQLRRVDYQVTGDDNDGQKLGVQAQFTFFNPKAGLSYQLNPENSFYSSFAIGHKEPNRSDFVDRPLADSPMAEKLYDLELGYRRNTTTHQIECTFYNMSYSNQLILTGALNDVGSSLRENVPDSYRRGLELSAGILLADHWNIGVGATFSQNKISNFTEVLYDYTDGFEIIENQYKDSEIAFSPSQIISGQLGYQLDEYFKINWWYQYIGDQYLDNTSNPARQLAAYGVSDLLLIWKPNISFANQLTLRAEVRNVFDAKYASNGYTYSYIFGDMITENFFYPQAGRNIMLTAVVGFGK